jgi:hypothetical protein
MRVRVFKTNDAFISDRSSELPTVLPQPFRYGFSDNPASAQAPHLGLNPIGVCHLRFSKVSTR